jgi:hypothetical protein
VEDEEGQPNGRGNRGRKTARGRGERDAKAPAARERGGWIAAHTTNSLSESTGAAVRIERLAAGCNIGGGEGSKSGQEASKAEGTHQRAEQEQLARHICEATRGHVLFSGETPAGSAAHLSHPEGVRGQARYSAHDFHFTNFL